jgi:DNA-directed RNA polymerase subunit RPC12/RpoP
MAKSSIECPLCDGMGILTTRNCDFQYRGELVNIEQMFYKCNCCGEEYTTDEVDDVSLKRIYEKYDEVVIKNKMGKTEIYQNGKLHGSQG